ncbi:unnamed protein product [Linum trigynum]|uniref:Uncharacterized protein n=1 Tax=Linum trigynum TaxID=586398 RepID=A0AAV2EFI9_9ROSI
MPSSEEPASMCLRSGERCPPGQRRPPASEMDTCKRKEEPTGGVSAGTCSEAQVSIERRVTGTGIVSRL